MSFEITEEIKYRLTGGIILIVLTMVLMPMLMKKSNQRFEENLSLHLRVPPKPKAPDLKIPTPQQVFNKVKVPSPQNLPIVTERKIKVQIAQAKPLESVIPSLSMEKAVAIVKPKPKVMPVKINEQYGVQLASFSHADNAEFLVKRLRKLGYDAKYSTIELQHEKIFKVVVGHVKDKYQAIELKKRLAENVQLEGMVVKQG